VYDMEGNKSKSRSGINIVIMIVSLVVVLFCVPAVFMYGNKFAEFLVSSGVIISPNFNDGYLIAEFIDPSGDVLLPFPQDSIYNNARRALDVRKFSVKKVEFNTLSGIGLEARLNVCFEFDGNQPNPFECKNKFSFPVIHVYIRTPGVPTMQNISDKTANANFHEEQWNYEIIIDGIHEQARVFDGKGIFLSNGLGLYTNYDYKKGHDGKQDSIIKTKITAGLPLKLIGDPAKGEWKYYVVIGLLDVKNPSMLYQAGKNSSNVFDYVVPDSLSRCEIDSSGKLSLSPLIVNYSKSSK
jgi:hypothetical protein